MKKDWTYKKLGEVLLVERGGSPRPIQEYITTADDGLNWIKIGDAVEGSKYITSTKEKIKPEGLKKTRFVHKGDFILSNSMSFGRPYILGIDGCIHDGWLVLRDNDDTFDKSYLYYYLSNPYLYEEFKRLAVGGVVNNLNSDIVRNVQVAIPPLAIQRSIVAELDLLHSVISKKKEQLRELDNLAQSLFYQMFGDPITNDMKWDTFKFADVFLLNMGKTPARAEVSYWTDGKYPWVSISDLCGDKFVTHTKEQISQKAVDETNIHLVPKGTVIMSFKLSIGKTAIAPFDLYTNEAIMAFEPKPETFVVPDFLYYYLQYYKWSGNRAVMGETINKAVISNSYTILPPLSLQQSFAVKVSAIEAQKQAITQSIQHTEALLAQRMDQYFG